MNTNIRKNAAFFAKYTCDDINASKRSSKFHNELKESDIVPVHKKKSKLSKENYRKLKVTNCDSKANSAYLFSYRFLNKGWCTLNHVVHRNYIIDSKLYIFSSK